MLGVVCNRRDISERISFFRGLIGPAHSQKDDVAVFFSLPQKALRDGFLKGMVMTGTVVRVDRVPIPHVILNLVTEQRKSATKGLRALGEHHGVYVVNPANRLNQLMVLQMLRSSETTCGYVAPYETVSRHNAMGCLEGRNDVVVIPEHGANPSLVAHGNRDSQASKRSLDRIPSPLIALQTPELKTNRSRLFVLRAHLQRSGDGQWRLLEHARILKKEYDRVIPGVQAGQAALAIADCAGKFIPRLGICFVDLVFGLDGKPFFLHLGGWDPRLIGSPDALAKASRDMQVDFWDWDLMGGRRQLYRAFSSNLLAHVALLERGVA